MRLCVLYMRVSCAAWDQLQALPCDLGLDEENRGCIDGWISYDICIS